MPKLLSRSKQEEFESNSALQIRDHKERKAKNTRKLDNLGNFQHARTVHVSCTVHYFSTVHLAARSCFLTLCSVCIFLFFPILSHVIAFGFGFFVTSLALSTI